MKLETLLPFRKHRPDAKVRLLCFAFAGGSADVYSAWSDLLPPHVDVCAVELPGHGHRLGERPISDMEALLDEIAPPLSALFDLPVVLFGHSLGGRVAFAFARREPRVKALIAAGAWSPHQPFFDKQRRSDMTRDDLVGVLRRLGRTPRAVLEDADLMDVFLSPIRADFRLLETYAVPADVKIDCPLVVLAARDDEEVSLAGTKGWESHAGGEYSFTEIEEGGHFFLISCRALVLEHVRATLARVAAEPR